MLVRLDAVRECGEKIVHRGKMLGGVIPADQSKSLSVGGSIGDAEIGPVDRDLGLSEGQSRLPIAIDFILPAGNQGLGIKIAEFQDNLLCREQFGDEFTGASRPLAAIQWDGFSGRGLRGDLAKLKVAHGGCVKEGPTGRPTEFLKFLSKALSGGETDQVPRLRVGLMRCAGSQGKGDGIASALKIAGKVASEASGRVIGESTNLVERFVGRACRDDDMAVGDAQLPYSDSLFPCCKSQR